MAGPEASMQPAIQDHSHVNDRGISPLLPELDFKEFQR